MVRYLRYENGSSMEKWKQPKFWKDEPGVKFCCHSLVLRSPVSPLTSLKNGNANEIFVRLMFIKCFSQGVATQYYMVALIISLPAFLNIKGSSLLHMAKMEHEGQLALSKSSCFPISVAMIGTIVCYLFFLHSLNILGHLIIGTSHQPVSSPMQEEKGSYGT